jgi:formylglycine-generating enzyme required for sulfatase activity
MGSTIFYCPFCGGANPPGAKFCSKCGVNVEKYSRPQPPAEALTQPVDRAKNHATTSSEFADEVLETIAVNDQPKDEQKVAQDLPDQPINEETGADPALSEQIQQRLIHQDSSTPPAAENSLSEAQPNQAGPGEAPIPPPIALRDTAKEKKKGKAWIWIILALLTLVVVFLVIIRAFDSIGRHQTTNGTTAGVTSSFTAVPTFTASPGIGATMTSEKDGMVMVFIPAGEFIMGSPDGLGDDDEHPQHNVYLDAYWIGSTEVTNAMYSKCVAEGYCTQASSLASQTRSSYIGNPEYSNYPVVKVNWYQADLYCKWMGGFLPTEAQWEKAARGTDGRTYPWGNESPTGDLVNRFTGDTAQVGSYPEGISPFGAYDMAGNVWEWVLDTYDADFYSTSSSTNPVNLTESNRQIMRGGSWNYTDESVRSAGRFAVSPYFEYNDLGFRCILPAN